MNAYHTGKYLNILLKLFKFLKESNAVSRSGPCNVDACSKILTNLEAIRRAKRAKWKLDINPNLEFLVENKSFCGPRGETRLIVGGYVDVAENLIQEQSISVMFIYKPTNKISEDHQTIHACHNVDPGGGEVVRRFHFDLDANLNSGDRPVSHLQYGGKLNPAYLNNSVEPRYRLFKAIDNPRLPSPPYDFTLVIDMFLRQIQTQAKDLVKEPYWGSLVSESEILWFRDYFQKIHSHLSQSKGNSTTYQLLCKPIRE